MLDPAILHLFYIFENPFLRTYSLNINIMITERLLIQILN